MSAYRVECEKGGCALCGVGALYTVVGLDETALSTSYSQQEEAEYVAEILNAAFEAGKAAK